MSVFDKKCMHPCEMKENTRSFRAFSAPNIYRSLNQIDMINNWKRYLLNILNFPNILEPINFAGNQLSCIVFSSELQQIKHTKTH